MSSGTLSAGDVAGLPARGRRRKFATDRISFEGKDAWHTDSYRNRRRGVNLREGSGLLVTICPRQETRREGIQRDEGIGILS
jgi:hypothetical protein